MEITYFMRVAFVVIYIAVCLAIAAAAIYFFILLVKALKKYINSKDVREEKKTIRKSLGEVLKDNRIHCKMTQEFVAETLGVSRQAVSKWENGTSDPSTSNLIALANLFGVSSQELLESTYKSADENNDDERQRG